MTSIFELILKNDTGGGGNSKAVAGLDSAEQTRLDELKQKENAETNGLNTLKGLISWKKVKGFIQQEVAYNVNTVELRTGRAEEQQKQQFIYQVASDTIGVMEGAVMGGSLDPTHTIGTILGAMLGLVEKAMVYDRNQRTINTQKQLEDITLQQQRIRAGTGGSRKSV